MENYKETQFKFLAYIHNLDEHGKTRHFLQHDYFHKRAITVMFVCAALLVASLVYLKYRFFTSP